MSGEDKEEKKQDLSNVNLFQVLKSSTDLTDGELKKFKRIVKKSVMRDCIPEAKVLTDCYATTWFGWCRSEVDAYWGCFHERRAYYISQYAKKFQDIGTKSLTKSYLDTDYHWKSNSGDTGSGGDENN